MPPDQPAYSLRRVWLSEEEQDGYYYGFANEGLWPLCHIAFVRPIFRESDWAHYVAVNRRFADAVVQEAQRDDPIVLVQDYHFAMLPRMIRERLPRATIITFWHIPVAERGDLQHLPVARGDHRRPARQSRSSASTRSFHCNNFLEGVDRFMESRIDRERNSRHARRPGDAGALLSDLDRMAAGGAGASGARRRMPRAVSSASACRPTRASPSASSASTTPRASSTACARSRRCWSDGPNGAASSCSCRPRRRRAASLEAYQRLAGRGDRARPTRSTRDFGDGGYKPIVLSIRHHEPDEVYELFRAADICVVSSLHDGMNLVSKEFVAARDDEQGVLCCRASPAPRANSPRR